MNQALRSIGRVLRLAGCCFILDPLAILSAGKKSRPVTPGVAIFCLHGMGDLLLCLNSVAALAKVYHARGFSVQLYVDEHNLELAQAIKGMDRIIPIRRGALLRNPVYRWKCLRQIARSGYVAAVQPTYNRFLIIEDSLMRATGADEKTGSSGSPMFIAGGERRVGDEWYTRLTACAPDAMHEIDRNHEFMSAFGVPVTTAWPELPSALAASAAPPRRGMVLMNINASHPLKSWPIERFEKLAHFIARKTGKEIVFVGAPGDASPAKAFRRWNSGLFKDCVGQTSLPSLMEWIAQSDLVIANDSAVAHLAALMQRQVVVIAGGGIPARYHPYPEAENKIRPAVIDEPMPCFGCGWRCRYTKTYDEPAPCMLGVPSTRVARAVLRGLAANADNAARRH